MKYPSLWSYNKPKQLPFNVLCKFLLEYIFHITFHWVFNWSC